MHSELFIRAGKEIVFDESDWQRVWTILKKIKDSEQRHKDEIESKENGYYFRCGIDPIVRFVEATGRYRKYRTAWEKKQVEQ